MYVISVVPGAGGCGSRSILPNPMPGQNQVAARREARRARVPSTALRAGSRYTQVPVVLA